MTAELKAAAAAAVEGRRAEIIGIGHRLHEQPETAFREHRAAELLTAALEAEGFAVERGAAGMPTAFVAELGDGPTTVAVCCEYDALPDVGHACGHNLIAAAGIGAAIGLAPLLTTAGLRLRVFGTPAEERGGGKELLLRAGAFDGVDAAMMVHPHRHFCTEFRSYAMDDLEVDFADARGRVSAAAPSLVADAVSGMALTAIGFLRQEVSERSRLFARIANGEPDGLNPLELSTLQVRLLCETPQEQDAVLAEVRARCEAIARGCGFSVAFREGHPRYEPFRGSPGLAAAFAANGTALGFGEPIEVPPHAATDMGNVSLAVPSVHAVVPAVPHDGPTPHSTAFAAALAEPMADEAIIASAVALAWTAIDVAADPALATMPETA